jgi:DNA repair photolyase
MGGLAEGYASGGWERSWSASWLSDGVLARAVPPLCEHMFVRWSNLTVEEESQHRLPGYRDPASVRRFDAPEALDMRFYEVQAKSVLNKVPDASQMPFRWTVNPYRGCSHACTYCCWGGTLVFMADGRTRTLEDLRVGDRIVGTRRDGKYRRFVETEVLAKWSSIKRAWQVELEDGTKLIASGDHRFLSRRGWKHVEGAEWGPMQRPYLTENNRLLGPGGCVDAPIEDSDYKLGYLTGMVRGDGTVGQYTYERASGPWRKHIFRLALADGEALTRAERFLSDLDVVTTRFLFSAATPAHRAVAAIRTQRGADVEQIKELIEWPALPTVSWTKGFLAGIFDAEGSCSAHALRISNADEEILDWICGSLSRLGFEHVLEASPDRPVKVIRLLGGLPERMRFFLGTDPAITRKRTIIGAALKCKSGLRVRSIRDLGMVMRMYDMTTGTEDFIANGVVSHNCFARPTHTYLGFNPGRDFEREIVVKVNAPEVLRAELARPSWKGEHVALGTNTDPYQWVEGRYKLMPGIWEALLDARNPSSVLTKSPLLLRDIELMKQLRERVGEFTACLSIPTLDEKAWRETEPHTPNPRARLEAVAELNRVGIPTGVLVAPLMPGINDAPHQVEPLLEAAEQAGATSIAGIALHLRGEVRDVFMDWMRAKRPDLVPRYEELYRRRAYAPQPERERLSRLVGKKGAAGRFRRGPWGEPAADRRPPEPREAAGQQALF